MTSRKKEKVSSLSGIDKKLVHKFARLAKKSKTVTSLKVK